MHTRSRRLRKKLRLGEFQELGFRVHAIAIVEVDEEQLWHSFIGEAIEANGLLFGGGVGRKIDGFVTVGARASATEEDRKALAVWMDAQSENVEFEIGSLVDAWHDA